MKQPDKRDREIRLVLETEAAGREALAATLKSQPEAAVKLAREAAEAFLSELPSSPRAAELADVADSGEVGELLEDAQQGSAGAVWQIIEEYEPHIQRVVRRRLSQRLRSKYDTQDFVQMVWKSFFEEPERLHGFENSRQLFGYLSKMAQNKVDAELRRRTTTQKYDLSKERPLNESDQEVRAERPQDSPSQIAIARERWNQLIADLPSGHQQVVRLRLQGLTFNQIAERLSIDEKTARRVLSRLVQEDD